MQERCFDISTLEEFENIFNQLEEQHQDKNGVIIITIFISSRIKMTTYLCSPNTQLDYFNPEKQPDHWVSVGDENDESGEIVTFHEAYSQEWIKIPKRHLIPKEQAWHAIQYFVHTGGQLTDKITWESPISRINNDDRNDPDYDNLDADVPF